MFSPSSLAVPFSAAALVLALSGVAKLRRPGSLVRMLGAMGIPAGPFAIRVLAAIELAVGAACLVSPRRAASAAMGLLYLSFAAVLALLLVRGIEVPSCGCAGDRDVPPSWIHVGLNLAAAATAVAAASTGPGFGGILGTAAAVPLAGAGFVVGILTISWLAVLCASYLPTVLFAYRGRA